MKFSHCEKTVRILDILYIAIVAAILLQPAMLMKLKPGVHVDNRPAAKFPILPPNNISDFPRQFEMWFNDRAAGRKNYGRIGNFLLFRLFRESPSTQIILGRDGFLFFASHHGGKENRNSLVWNLFNFKSHQVEKAANDFIALFPELERSPAKVIFINVPTKHLLYFDKMPAYITDSVSEPRRYWATEVTKEIIRHRPDAARYFADLRSEAERAASTIQLIPIRNFHWIPGPYTHLASNVIARHLRLTDKGYIPKFHDYRLIKDNRSDLEHFIYRGLRSPALATSDEDFSRIGITKIQGLEKSMQNVIPGAKALNTVAECAFNPSAKGGKMLLVGDSFTRPLCQDMARYCKEVVSIEYTALLRYIPKSHAIEMMQQLVARWHPEYIVVVSHYQATAWTRDVIDMQSLAGKIPVPRSIK